MKCSIFAIALLSLPMLAARADEPPLPHAPGIESKGYVWNEPNKEEARALAHKGDPAKGKIAYEVCRGCHKNDASGRPEYFPQLAGQLTTVLIKQMVDIRAGRRDNPKMHPFISDEWVTTPEEISDIAAYLHSLPQKPNGKGNGQNLERGKAIYTKNCAKCHGDEGEGDAKEFYPRVAGQHYRYLFRESIMIRDACRRNANPKMVKVIKRYDDEDLEAVADYMSRLGSLGQGSAGAK
jgi:cytochrome c553